MRTRTIHGTGIRLFSARFFVVFSLAALMSLLTIGSSLVFSGLWAIRRMGRSGARRVRGGNGRFELVCISHVPWDGVWQRNQQTMSRLSRSEKVIYVRSASTIEVSDNPRHLAYFFGKAVDPGLLVLNPVTLWGDTRIGLIRRLNRWILISFIRFGMLRAGFAGSTIVLWFYFPRHESVCGGLGERLVVYDIQDEYLTWTNAAPDIGARERRLLEKTHLVFTGTNSLFRKKRQWNPNIHFIQNGVESDHFSRALREDTEVPAGLKRLLRPVIGYFGLIGDRIDCPLLEAMAEKHPEWSIVLVGPVREEMCKVPRKENIHLTGQVDYTLLPGYLKGFDVAIIPYLLNETTMDLNPTKLLEYMAGGRPVVSTAMTDVVELFGEFVGVAHDRDEFLALTEKFAGNPDEAWIRRGIEFANGFTWEAMVQRMREMILKALEKADTGCERR